MKRAVILSLFLGIFIVSAYPAISQEQTPQQPSTEEVEKEKVEREKNAYRLLDQVIDEAQSLRLAENRVRIQINAADLLWKNNQSRARSLFTMAAEGVAELGRPTTQPNNNRVGFVNAEIESVINRGGQNRSFQLRQELVLAAARHDAALAYQLLAATKPPVTTTPTVVAAADQRGPRPQINLEDNLETTLLGRIAALDPKLAAQNAELMMDKGQFPRTLNEVISQLQKQDAEAGAKLADKTVKKIQAANILTNTEAGNLAQSLLSSGPRSAATPAATPSSTTETTSTPRGRPAVLEQQAYTDLLTFIIDAALKATPQAQANARTQNVRRIGPGANGGGPAPAAPSEAQVEQGNARRLLATLQSALPLIDQYVPAKAAQVRQKMTELGISTTASTAGQSINALQGNPNSDAIMQAAAAAPAQLQPRMYQQAAYKALEEGNSDRARQIANDHLQATAKDAVIQRVELRELAKKSETTRIDEIRMSLAKLSEADRVNALLSLAKDVEKSNPKLMNQLLDDARQMTNRRATNYSQFEQQLRVANAFAVVDPARSFEVLDPGISQLNELLQAASVLSGFESNLFRDGEMSMQAGSGLTTTVSRYGQELANLARTDFERSETLAGRFQFPEPRIMVRLSIVQGLLNTAPANQQPGNIIRNFGQNFVVRQD
jgi:hypothetical protein